jgi:hypothetical protein
MRQDGVVQKRRVDDVDLGELAIVEPTREFGQPVKGPSVRAEVAVNFDQRSIATKEDGDRNAKHASAGSQVNHVISGL